jgi:hypothetical protein
MAARLRELADRAQRLADGRARVSLANLLYEELLHRHRAHWVRAQEIITGLRSLASARPLARPVSAAADELTRELQQIATAVAGGAAMSGPLAARIGALPARFAALAGQAQDAVLGELRRLNERARPDGLTPDELDAFLTAVARQLRRGTARGRLTVGDVRAGFRKALLAAALGRFGPEGELGRRFAAELAVSTAAGGPARTLPLDALRALQAPAGRTDTDHDAWLREFRAAAGAVRARLDRVRADLVGLAARAAAGKFDLPPGTTFGFAHAIAWLEVNRLAANQGVGLVGLGRQIGVGNQDTVKGLSVAQPGRYVRRLGNIARLAVDLTGGPLTVQLLESVRRLADAIRSSDPAIGDNVTERDVDGVIRWLTGVPATYVPTQGERDELRRLADRAKNRIGGHAVGVADIQAQWQIETGAARRLAGEVRAEVTAAREILHLAVGVLDGDARATLAAGRDELGRDLARHLDRVWLSGDRARRDALDWVRRRARELVTEAQAALRQRVTGGGREVTALLDVLAARGGDAAAPRARLGTLRARLAPLTAAALTADTARTTIEVLRGLAALRPEAAAAAAAAAAAVPPRAAGRGGLPAGDLRRGLRQLSGPRRADLPDPVRRAPRCGGDRARRRRRAGPAPDADRRSPSSPRSTRPSTRCWMNCSRAGLPKIMSTQARESGR